MELVYGTQHFRKVSHFDESSLPPELTLTTVPRAQGTLASSGSAESRIIATRNRLNVIRQCILRNDHFSPSTLPSKDRENLLTVGSKELSLSNAPLNCLSAAEINETTAWTRRGPLSTVWHAHALERGQALCRGSGRFRRTRLFATSKSLRVCYDFQLVLINMYRINQAKGCLLKAVSLWWRVNTPKTAPCLS